MTRPNLLSVSEKRALEYETEEQQPLQSVRNNGN
jgi:hypothetical protein